MAEHFYFTSLELSGIRCFGPEKQRLDLADRDGKPSMWNVLLGDNGTGKTTVLQVLACAARKTDRQAHTLIYKMESEVPNDWRIVASFADMAKRTSDMSMNSDSAEGFVWSYSLPTPVRFAAYGAKRRFGYDRKGNDDWIDDAAATLFDDEVALASPQSRMIEADYLDARMNFTNGASRYAQIRSLLLQSLPDVHDIRIKLPETEARSPRLEFNGPFGWVPVDKLGLGYRTLIAWLVDFSQRMLAWYPDSPNPLAEPAICLVDEIDLHLHPKWQRQIVSHLREHFPKTQFIVTAHSPLIVQASADANIALLRRDGDHVVIDNDLDRIRNWRVDQILTSELYGLPSARPPYLDKLLAERRSLLSKRELTAEDKVRARQLDEEIGALPGGEDYSQARRMEEMLARAGAILSAAEKR